MTVTILVRQTLISSTRKTSPGVTLFTEMEWKCRIGKFKKSLLVASLWLYNESIKSQCILAYFAFFIILVSQALPILLHCMHDECDKCSVMECVMPGLLRMILYMGEEITALEELWFFQQLKHNSLHVIHCTGTSWHFI